MKPMCAPVYDTYLETPQLDNVDEHKTLFLIKHTTGRSCHLLRQADDRKLKPKIICQILWSLNS
jgi:hypothetical protein